MRKVPATALSGYLFAVLVAAAAVGVRWLLQPWLAAQLPLVTLFAAVAAAVWFGGYRPAIVAAVVGFLACDYLFIEPAGPLGFSTPERVIGLLAYLASCGVIIGFGEAMRRVQAQAQAGREVLRTTLGSIGDAVISTDIQGRVVYLNAVAETLTGWNQPEAAGQPLEAVFHIVNEATREPADNPVLRALRVGAAVGLANHTLLLARDGTARPIDDSAAPIHDEHGEVTGCVLIFRDISARRQAERALERSERDLRDFFDHAAVGLHWVSPDGTILRVNETELQLLGYERDEYVGRHIGEFHVDTPVIEDILARLTRGETLREYPARMRRKDGSIRDVLINSNVLFEGGEFVHTRCFTRDVTELKRAHETRAVLGAIIESSDDAIVSKTLEGTILSWNGGAQRVFGYTAAEAVGQPITLIIPPELEQEERTILQRLNRGERLEHFETVRVTKSGRRVDISLTISPVRDHTGRIIGASKVARDISGRKAAEALLRESEARFRTFADSAPVLMWLTDASGYTFVNRAYLDFLGVQAQAELSGYGWIKYIHPDERDTCLARYLACYARREPFAAEFRLRGHDNEYRWMRATGVVRLSEAGALLGYTGCIVDVHQARVAATALQEADRRKDEFLATLAHELRNPLAAVRNALEIMRRASTNAALVAQARDTIDRQMSQMQRLIDDLLDISRITLNRLELRRQPVELAAVLRAAVETCRPLVEGQGHNIVLTLPPVAVYLHGDPVRLAQVFGNLLNNACKYTPPGGHIVLRAERQGSEVVVITQDNGIGIAAELLPRIFDMFAQGDQGVGHSQSGLGIGLTLVRRLVEMHGGQIEVSSAGKDQGSEFVVRLPILVEELTTARPAVPELSDAIASHRVLVVDDNTDSADSLTVLLQLVGQQTRVAYEGLAAVEAAEQFQPELILLDVGLPQIDGFEVCRRIRAQNGSRSVKIVAVTGWGQNEDRRKSAQAGFDGHMVKPVDFAALMQLLAALPPTDAA